MSGDNDFTGLVLEKTDGGISAGVKQLGNDALPDGDVTVAVRYSTLNYKDALILNGRGGLVKTYPHVPGIDFAGVVETSTSPDFKPGDEVILTGWRVGEIRWGGYAARARVKGEWLVPLPEGMALKQAMAIGTAGFTAMLALMALEERGLTPSTGGEVLVTGAAGGVGSVAVALLSALGYSVVASTGREEAHDYLRDLSAAAVVDRGELATAPEGPLGSARWSAAIDAVGGTTLSTVLATLRPGGICAAVGLAGGAALNTTVIPFLLRGIDLVGIDSVFCPLERRKRAWHRLAAELPTGHLDRMAEEVSLSDLPALAGRMLGGGVRGRQVVDLTI